MYELYLIILSTLSLSSQASFTFFKKEKDSQHRIKDIFCLKNKVPFLLYFHLRYNIFLDFLYLLLWPSIPQP